MEKRADQQTRVESKQALVEHIEECLRSGDYPRVLDLLRGAAAEFPDDVELSELEKRAQEGIRRKAEADRLITESQELFAQGKSAEAIQVLRKAYDLDKNNTLSRAILANALVEHAQSIVETDWLEAEKLTNQALGLNPTHPTAKTILNLIVDRRQPALSRTGFRKRASCSPPEIFSVPWHGLPRDWRFIPTIPKCFRSSPKFSATRMPAGARTAATIWMTCGAWQLKSTA